MPLEGEHFRYHVESMTRAGVRHLVDLQENEWVGKCSCEEFSYRCQPAIDRGYKKRCIHITKAQEAWFEQVAPMVAKALEGGKKKAGVVGNHAKP